MKRQASREGALLPFGEIEKAGALNQVDSKVIGRYECTVRDRCGEGTYTAE